MVTYHQEGTETSWRERAEQVARMEAAARAGEPGYTGEEGQDAGGGGTPDPGADRGMVLPPQVSMILDAAMDGMTATGRRDGEEGRTYTNLGVIVGQIEAVRRRRDERHVTTRSAQGDQRYSYYLTVNDVASDAESVYQTRYRFPIGMSTEMHTRYAHLLQDGMRVILVGPIMFERSYDQGLRQTRDALDPGMPVWNVRIEVITIEEAPDHLGDFGKVVFEGEVAREPRYTRRLSGPGGTMDIYAEVLLRDRRRMTSGSGVPRTVTTTLPVEVLVAPEEEIIPGSDAMLVVGSRVRIAGHLGMRTIRRNPRRNTAVSNVLDRVAEEMRQRNAVATERLATYRAEMADVPRGQRSGYSGPQPVDDETLERRIGFAQRNVVEQELVQIEVGAVTVLTQRTSVNDDDRAHLITQGLERSRRRGSTGPRAEPRRATETERTAALDTATDAAVSFAEQEPAAHAETNEPAQEAHEHGTSAPRPRRKPAPATVMDGAAAVTPEDAATPEDAGAPEDAAQHGNDIEAGAAGDA